MRFDVPNVPYHVPVSPRTRGYEYVWHCHILEHEEHDMMRPLIVMPKNDSLRTAKIAQQKGHPATGRPFLFKGE